MYEHLIKQILHLSEVARQRGVLGFETEVEEQESLFLKTGLALIIDGTDPEAVSEILQNLIDAEDFSREELIEHKIMKQGVLAIQQGENPRLLGLRLYAILGKKHIPPQYFDYQYYPQNEQLQKLNRLLHSMHQQKALPESAFFEKELLILHRWDKWKLVNRLRVSWPLIPALYGCSSFFVFMLMQDISLSVAIRIAEDWEDAAPPDKASILQAQTDILNFLKRLIDSGEIMDPIKILSQAEIDAIYQSFYARGDWHWFGEG